MTKKTDFVKIDELWIIVSFIEKSLTDNVKLIICERVVQIVIKSDYRNIKNRLICKNIYKIFKYIVKRNENICVWKLFKWKSNETFVLENYSNKN